MSTPFDARMARAYDALVAERTEPDRLAETVDFLTDRARGGAALEFAVGTGRVAIPLAERGIDVAGIDISLPMLEQLKAKPGGHGVRTVIGDMATVRVPGVFRLVFLVFNSITNLTTQDAQVACFRNAARHLGDGGAFVVEVGVPQLRRLPPGDSSLAFDISAEHCGVDRYTDFVEQQMWSDHYWPAGAGPMAAFSSQHRFVWPSELDLMARLGGLRLEQRWADWDRSPFTGESESHVSVWVKA